jgi:hypothetical protein
MPVTLLMISELVERVRHQAHLLMMKRSSSSGRRLPQAIAHGDIVRAAAAQDLVSLSSRRSPPGDPDDRDLLVVVVVWRRPYVDARCPGTRARSPAAAGGNWLQRANTSR